MWYWDVVIWFSVIVYEGKYIYSYILEIIYGFRLFEKIVFFSEFDVLKIVFVFCLFVKLNIKMKFFVNIRFVFFFRYLKKIIKVWK